MIAGLLPAPLHRAAYRFAHALRKQWWRLARPHLRGCRVMALDGEGRVLLIRHSYGSGKWMIPGGGLDRGEAAVPGGLRELREETGCELADVIELALSEELLSGTTNEVHVIAGRTFDAPRVDGREVIEARFFALDALPGAMPAAMRAMLPGWVADYEKGRNLA